MRAVLIVFLRMHLISCKYYRLAKIPSAKTLGIFFVFLKDINATVKIKSWSIHITNAILCDETYYVLIPCPHKI